MTEVAKDLAPTHFPSIIQSQTVNGKLVALPIFTDAPAVSYTHLDVYKRQVLPMVQSGMPVPLLFGTMAVLAGVAASRSFVGATLCGSAVYGLVVWLI